MLIEVSKIISVMSLHSFLNGKHVAGLIEVGNIILVMALYSLFNNR